MTTVVNNDQPYVLESGVFRPPRPITHREEEYDSRGFKTLLAMQEKHFWYQGRHRFLLHAFRKHAKRLTEQPPPRIIDLGGGCGGWVRYLLQTKNNNGLINGEVALADSSEAALEYAARVLPASVHRYQIDLLDLHWKDRWETAFLLDVLEHIPDDQSALQQIHQALAPGGLLLITVPALQFFWSWNDEFTGHQRRYSCGQLKKAGQDAGFEVLDLRYFQFFLSGLFLLSRRSSSRRAATFSEEERRRLLEQTHRTPSAIINRPLTWCFGAETPLGHWLRFPWGTSCLAVLQKPHV